MNFTISTMARSLAAYLASTFPDTTFFEDPNQQGTEVPAMFLQQRYSYIEKRQGGRFLRRIGFDLTYLLDYNLPDMQAQYEKAAEKLDLVMETFPYSDGETQSLLRTYNREWRIDLDYKFELQVWVSKSEEFAKMERMDYTQDVTE